MRPLYLDPPAKPVRPKGSPGWWLLAIVIVPLLSATVCLGISLLGDEESSWGWAIALPPALSWVAMHRLARGQPARTDLAAAACVAGGCLIPVACLFWGLILDVSVEPSTVLWADRFLR